MPSLTRLDDCIEFFNKNPNYLESENYLNQFRYLQNQALITIKNYVVNTICQNSKKVLPQSNEDLSQGENVFTLFYGKFQTFAPKIKSLADILERREHLDERYADHFDHHYFITLLFTCWFTNRILSFTIAMKPIYQNVIKHSSIQEIF